MKVAYFAESPADQAALTLLTEAILKRKTDTARLTLHFISKQKSWKPPPRVSRQTSQLLKNSFPTALALS